MTGTGLAQAITILFSPVLTRIFTPEEFGIFYLFSAIADIVFVPATGKYELATLIPEEDKEATNTMWTAGILATFSSILLLILIYLLKERIGNWVNEPLIIPYLYWLPVFVFIRGWMLSFHYWHNRQKRFKIITGSKILEVSTNVFSRIGLGLMNFGTTGLIVGVLLGRVTTLSNYFYFWKKKDASFFPNFSTSSFFKQLKRFKNFPINMVPAGLFNISSIQLPNILIKLFYTATTLGHYGFMNRIIRTPMGIIGKSFDEVFKQKASEELRIVGNCKNIFYKTLKKLLILSILPFTLFYFIAPPLFDFVFGSEWRIAGEYARIFTIPLFINFSVSSLSSIFYLKEKTRLFSRLNLLQLTLVIFAFFICHYYKLEAIQLIRLLAIAYGISYSLMLIFLVKIVEE